MKSDFDISYFSYHLKCITYNCAKHLKWVDIVPLRDLENKGYA